MNHWFIGQTWAILEIHDISNLDSCNKGSLSKGSSNWTLQHIAKLPSIGSDQCDGFPSAFRIGKYPLFLLPLPRQNLGPQPIKKTVFLWITIKSPANRQGLSSEENTKVLPRHQWVGTCSTRKLAIPESKTKDEGANFPTKAVSQFQIDWTGFTV